MVDAAWKYAHKKQIILDGTFGVCDRRMLLFIALGVDETGKGVPLAFLLFSAPTGNKATQAGYDTTVLYELLKAWHDSLGTWKGEIFKPTIVITDTDTKERGTLILLWLDIILLLCKFHIRQCWTNRRKKVLHIGQTNNFPKQQVQNRLRALEDRLILSVEHAAAQQLITNETQVLHSLKQRPEMVVAANAGLNFLKYLRDTWMPVSLWNGWSQKGCIDASQVLQTSIEGVIPTTNHLEAFDGLLKRKYISQWQRGGNCLRLDLFVYLLIMDIVPSMFSVRRKQESYYSWLCEWFRVQAGGADLVATHHCACVSAPPLPKLTIPVVWWSTEGDEKHHDEANYIVTHEWMGGVRCIDIYTIEGTCASSTADIQASGHKQYNLRLSVYGWGYCSCPYFTSNNGACKHLWALRLIIPKLVLTKQIPPASYTFHFPATEIEAREVYASCFGLPSSLHTPEIPPVPETSSSCPGFKLSQSNIPSILDGDLPTALPEFDAVADRSKMWLLNTAEDILDVEENGSLESGSGSDSDDENDCVDMASRNREGIELQLQCKVDHLTRTVLPPLHGLVSALDDGATQEVNIVASQDLEELHEAFLKFEKYWSCLTGQPQVGQFSTLSTRPPPEPSQNAFGRHTGNRAEPANLKRLRLPSPEHRQRRKQSHAEY
ncbi:hypothetical protein K439DRAFT_1619397 [Ramaria rubella]|nr:hypothetical protein K439DRAFT_1619397 [Ramaria rubella]